MMKMSTHDLPPALHQCNNVWFFNLSITQIPGTPAADDTPERPASYECDSIALPGAPSRAALISAGMQARYSKDDEIAALNNKLVGDGVAFEAYQAYRVSVKDQVDAAGYPAAVA